MPASLAVSGGQPTNTARARLAHNRYKHHGSRKVLIACRRNGPQPMGSREIVCCQFQTTDSQLFACPPLAARRRLVLCGAVILLVAATAASVDPLRGEHWGGTVTAGTVHCQSAALCVL